MILEAAQQLYQQGLTVIPVMGKRPTVLNWQKRIEQTQPVPNGEYTDDPRVTGVGVVCGSKHDDAYLCALDADIYDRDASLEFYQWLHRKIDPAFRIGNPPKFLMPFLFEMPTRKRFSAKFRHCDIETGELSEQISQVEILGTGNHFVAYGIHPDTNEPYDWVNKHINVAEIPVLNEEELAEIMAKFEEIAIRHGLIREEKNKFEYKEAAFVEPQVKDRAGDYFQKTATWEDILIPHGWKFDHSEGEISYWIRPGKEEGISASTNYGGFNKFYCFSTNAEPFEADKGYSKFRAHVFLNYEGDFKQATRDFFKKHPEYSKPAETPFQAQIQARETDTGEFIALADINIDLKKRELIRSVLDNHSMVVTYGESNSGKTFHVVDRDICIATGRSWYDLEVEQGMVVYVAGEGFHSVSKRILAYRQYHGIDTAPFYVLPRAVNLFDPNADLPSFIDAIKRLEDEAGQGCKKITIDTLARAMIGGNENAAEDMGLMVANADYLRFELDCCLEFVHHSGKDTARGARGHSSLRAATDTEIEVSKDESGLHVARVTKQRNLDSNGKEFDFKLEVVDLGLDSYGYPATTCVPLPAEKQVVESEFKLQSVDHQFLGYLYDAMKFFSKEMPAEVHRYATNKLFKDQKGVESEEFYSYISQRGHLTSSTNNATQRSAIKRSRDRLQRADLIGYLDGWYWIVDN